MILELVRIGIHRREREPWEQSNGASDLRLHNVAHVALDVTVEIRTNRLMNVTDAKRLFIRQHGLIMERRVEQKVSWCQHAEPLCAPRFLPDKILVHLQAEP